MCTGEINLLVVILIVLVTGESVDMVLAHILVVVQELLGVQDTVVVLGPADRGTVCIGETVHAVGGLGVPEADQGLEGLVVGDVGFSGEILQEAGTDIALGGHVIVGLGILSLRVEQREVEAPRSGGVAERVLAVGDVGIITSVIDVGHPLSIVLRVLVGIRDEITVDITGVHLVEDRAGIDPGEHVLGHVTRVTSPTGGLGIHLTVRVGEIGAGLQPVGNLGVDVGTGRITLEAGPLDVGRIGQHAEGDMVVDLVGGAGSGDVVLLAEAGSQQDVSDGTFTVAVIEQLGVGVDLAISAHEVGAGHRSRSGGTGTRRGNRHAGNIVEHLVAQTVAAETTGRIAGIVKEVGGSKLGGGGGVAFQAGGVAALAVIDVIIDGLPGELVHLARTAVTDLLEAGVGTDGVDTGTGLEGDLRLALLATLGGHEDDTVRTAGTVQGGGGGILQDGDAFDIVPVDGREDVGTLDGGRAVNDDEGVGVVRGGGTDTTDTDTHIQTGLTVDNRGLQTRHLAFQGAGYGTLGLDDDVLIADRRDRTGQVFLLRGTVSDVDEFVEHLRVLGERYVDDGTGPGNNFLVRKSDAREDEGGTGSHIETVVTIQICHGSGRGALDDDTDARNHFALRIRNLTGNGILGECLQS